jgi:integrase
MTSPQAQSTDEIDGLYLDATTPVLSRREIYAQPTDGLPVFGDSRWDLAPACPDRHSAGQAILWGAFPQTLRESCKYYVFALVNVVENAPRLPGARSDFPAVKTIWGEMPKLRFFLNWLVGRGIHSFADVTWADLDDYLHHVTDSEGTTDGWKRTRLVAVQRLHAYRDVLPEHCRLPAGILWEGASAAELVNATTPWFQENTTPRIHPDVMGPLLSAALLTVDVIAKDVLPTARELVAMRHLAHRVAPDCRRVPRGRPDRPPLHEVNREQLRCLLAGLAEAGGHLPGRREGQETVVDLTGLAAGGWLNIAELTRRGFVARMLEASALPVKANLLRVTRFSSVDGHRWRTEPIEADELIELLRHIVTACFLVITYLSGVRTGEALNLRRGCITRDTKLGMIFMSGEQLKVSTQRRKRSPETIPWVVTEEPARAVSVLEALTVGPMLFPPGRFYAPDRFDSTTNRTLTPGAINLHISGFISWFNTAIAPVVGHPRIDEDPDGKIVAPRLRRTLAWHIVRKPGGTAAGATQYGHLYTQLIQGYAGRADAGFLGEISFEQYLVRAETIFEDSQKVDNGEHVSGPAAGAYRERVAAGSKFAGLTITTPSQVNNALANPDLQVHHGELLTCVYRPATAACRTEDDAGDTGPSWPRCRLTCQNIARTDRDVTALREHVRGLKADLAAPGLPLPLHQRIRARLEAHEQAIAEHEAAA